MQKFCTLNRSTFTFAIRCCTAETPEKKIAKPRNYWKNVENQRKFMKEVEIKLGFKSLDDWYHVTTSQFKKLGGCVMLNKYPSFLTILQTFYPNHEWDVFKRKQTSKYYWKNEENQKNFLDKLLTKQNENTQITSQLILQARGRRLFHYNSSIDSLIAKYCPDKHHLINRPRNYWSNVQNQRKFLDELAQKLGITDLKEWNNVSDTILLVNGAFWIRKKYKSLFEALQATYPEYPWNVYERFRKPRNYWSEDENILQFLELLKSTFHIKKKDDWIRISNTQIYDLGGGGLIKKYGNLGVILSKYYPEETWDISSFVQRDKRATQRWLFLQILKLLPDYEIFEDFLFMKFATSGTATQFDIYIPTLKLAFEYHGEHHYNEINAFGSLALYQKRDEHKRQEAIKNYITLIEVNYNWDGSLSSLIELIIEKFPEGKEIINKQV